MLPLAIIKYHVSLLSWESIKLPLFRFWYPFVQLWTRYQASLVDSDSSLNCVFSCYIKTMQNLSLAFILYCPSVSPAFLIPLWSHISSFTVVYIQNFCSFILIVRYIHFRLSFQFFTCFWSICFMQFSFPSLSDMLQKDCLPK